MALWNREKSRDRDGIEQSRTSVCSSTEDLLTLIRERVSCVAAERDASESLTFEPANVEAIAEAEKTLDFALPQVLKRVLLEIGNGGFGPGHGLLGVRGGATDEHGNSLVDLYDCLSATHDDDPGWRWPQQLVPICPWGDSTYSCVDCSSQDGQVVTFDANGHRPGADLARLLEPQDLTLEAWLRAWAEGVDLWKRMFSLE